MSSAFPFVWLIYYLTYPWFLPSESFYFLIIEGNSSLNWLFYWKLAKMENFFKGRDFLLLFSSNYLWLRIIAELLSLI